jgi:hypothetical protein
VHGQSSLEVSVPASIGWRSLGSGALSLRRECRVWPIRAGLRPRPISLIRRRGTSVTQVAEVGGAGLGAQVVDGRDALLGAPPPRPTTLQVLVGCGGRRRRESPGAQPGGDGLLDGGHAAGPRQGSDRLGRAGGTRPSGHDGAVPAGWLRWLCGGGHGAPMVKSAPSVWSPNARPRMARNGVVHRAVESLRIEFRRGVVGGWSPR